MYANYVNNERAEYDGLVARVRKHFPHMEISNYCSYELEKLRKLDAQRKVDEARAAEARPLNEALDRLHQTYRRSLATLGVIREKQGYLAKNQRLHALNGISPTLLEPVEQPAAPGSFSTVDACDAANAEASVLATALETRAQKLVSYVSGWEGSAPEQRLLNVIFALADRLDRLEAASSAKAE
jgi:hypothetical protein